jgi:hypothetical protein
MSIDWSGTPLREFSLRWERQENGLLNANDYPYGKGAAQEIMIGLWADVESTYEKLIPYELDEAGDVVTGDDVLHWERTGEVPIIRKGYREYVPLDSITLSDLPAILETFVVLDQELEQHKSAIAERKKAEARYRERVRSKERRKLKKLGEW